MSNSLIATIGMISYNAEDTILTALDSALNQTWPNVEIVIVDDCSSDNTLNILKRAIGELSEVRLLENKQNQGVAHNRNKIIEHANGEFIVFFDDDDISDENRVEVQINAIVEAETIHAPTISYTARRQLFADNSKRIESAIDFGSGREVADRILFGKPLNSRSIGSFATCSQAARKSTYLSLNGFNEKFRRCEDTDFAVRAALKNYYFVGVKAPLVTQTMTSSSEKNLEEESKYNFMLLHIHKQYLLSIGRHQHCIDWLDAKFTYYRGKKWRFVLKLLKLFIKNPLKSYERLMWAIPNVGFNRKFKQYKREG